MALICVRHIDYRTTDEELYELVARFGRVKSVDRGTDEDGRRHSHAFVEMYNLAEARAAISKLDGTEHPSGNRLDVTESGYNPLPIAPPWD